MADLEKFRNETRAWLEANCPPDMRLPFADEDDRYWGGRNAAFKSEGAAPLVRTDGGARLDRAGMAEGIRRRRPLARGSEDPARRDAPRSAAARRSIRFGIWMLGPALLELRQRSSRSANTCRRSCAARSAGARATPSRTPAPTLRRWRRAPRTRATIFSSTARRSGRPTPTRPTGSSAWCAPIRRRRSTTASASSCSTCARRACRPSRSC